MHLFNFTDRNECIPGNHRCAKSKYCRNTIGSFKCECPKGHEGNASIKCSLTRWARFTTPKHLLNDLKKGAWDTILVVIGAGAVAMAIVFLILRKMCRKCCSQGKRIVYITPVPPQGGGRHLYENAGDTRRRSQGYKLTDSDLT